MSTTEKEGRFPTSNTNLAACLGALRIPIKQTQPITIVEEADTGKRKLTYFFEIEGQEFLGEKHFPQKIEYAWRERARFERENPDHPLIYMRWALDANDWLTKAWHGRITPTFSDSAAKFETDSQELAACIMACGFPLLRLEKPSYFFERKPQKELLDHFENFRLPSCESSPVALMRRVLKVRSELLTLCKHPDLVPLIHHLNGDPFNGGAEAYIPANLPQAEVDRVLSILYSI